MGESIINGDVVVKRKDRELRRIAFTGGKLEQLRLISENLPEDTWVVSLAASAIPYALERGEVDGAVIDSTRYPKLKGEYEIVPYDGEYVTYVLVMKKDLVKSDEFRNFKRLYNRVVLEKMKNIDMEKDRIMNDEKLEEIDRWKPMYIPFELEE